MTQLPSADELLKELKETTTLIRLLKPVSAIFEKRAKSWCVGKCKAPEPLGTLEGITLHCCAFHSSHERYLSALQTKKRLQAQLAQGQYKGAPPKLNANRTGELKIMDTFARDFTATAQIRKRTAKGEVSWETTDEPVRRPTSRAGNR